jgi:ATP-dependent helicase YprA (DUF1998 family)
MLAAAVQTLGTIAVAALVTRALLAALRSRASRFGPGPIFVFAALVTGLTYAIGWAYFATKGLSFERGIVSLLFGAPPEALAAFGQHENIFGLGISYAVLQGVFLLVTTVTAWALGFGSEDVAPGGVAREVEAELGTTLAERFFKLCGHMKPGAPEMRFFTWNERLVKALKWARWLSLPAALSGTVPPALWAAGAIVIEGLAVNLTEPPDQTADKARKQKEAGPPGVSLRDPNQLVQALSHDPRGPELEVHDGGALPGNVEHLAPQTRIAEESLFLRHVLGALEIPGFYVHQEAASEALLGGRNVLMETAPLSGRRTLCDVLALRSVLLEGTTVLYLSPDPEESARRARAFRDVAKKSNWRWAIHHHDLAAKGRSGLDLKARQPQIVFTTPEDLHRDLCPNHGEWNAFLSGLALVVAIDLDRYTGAKGANLSLVMRRLHRLVKLAGAKPRVLATVAPYGPDVLGFSERLLGCALDVVGPESDSRGSPMQQIVVGLPQKPAELHPAVGARGVAIACGYKAEGWGWGSVLSSFEQEQQVNRVLLDFGKAVIAPDEDTHLRMEQAEALVTRLSAEKAAMLAFFTRHTGRKSIGVWSGAAEEVGKKTARDVETDAPFDGFSKKLAGAEAKEKRVSEAAEKKLERPKPAPKLEEDEKEEPVDETAPVAEVEVRADRVVGIWIPDEDPFTRLLAQNPVWLHPASLHPMLAMGSSLVAVPESAELGGRHLACAAAEAPIERGAAVRDFSAAALERILPRLSIRKERVLDAEGAVVEREMLSGITPAERGSTFAASASDGTLLDRADGEAILTTDRARIACVCYPGRVLAVEGRRYRVLPPDQQPRLAEGVLIAETERRRVTTTRIRTAIFTPPAGGHELDLGGELAVRFHQPRIELTETVFGVRSSHTTRAQEDQLTYEAPIVATYATRAALVHLPGAREAALHALSHLARRVLPTFVRHREDDIDVTFVGGSDPALAFVDRHPGEIGFARAVSAEVVRHVLWWSRAILVRCGETAECQTRDGCQSCVHGVACASPATQEKPSRKALLDVLTRVLGS